MPGKPGRSGGRREGAGPKFRKFALEVGHKYASVQQLPDGHLPGRLATVVEVTRTECVIEFDDGERLTLIR